MAGKIQSGMVNNNPSGLRVKVEEGVECSYGGGRIDVHDLGM
jgi:hypothetical protein